MAKRRHSGMDILVALPWPAGIAVGLVGYVAIRHGIGWYLEITGGPYLSGLGELVSSGTYAPIGWTLLIACWLAAVFSFIGRARRRHLLEGQTGMDSLRQMSWRQFEQLTGEAFRRQGYAIEETGLGGADGGIDLLLRKDGSTTLVQCKQWQNRQVGVKIVREMYGLLLHHNAAAVKIVALGDYTDEARQFAQDKPIELIHGGQLMATVRSVQTRARRASSPMDSPLTLSASMVASLLVIGVIPSASVSVPSPAISQPVARQPEAQPIPSPTHLYPATPPLQSHAVIYASDTGNDAQFRDWKKRHAESMKILQKTTKELPLR